MRSSLDILSISNSAVNKKKLKQHRSQRKRDIRRIDESDTEESESDTDQDSDFLDESVRHLAVGKVKISKVSDSD